jgi:hypothetical protein
VYELLERVEKRTFGEHFWNVSQRVQINFIFIDNVRIYRLWNSKFVGELFSNGIYHLLCSFVISTKDGGLGLPSLYRMHKLYKCPCKHCYITGYAQWTSKPLSKLLWYILSTVKARLESYCEWNRCGFWQILKICKEYIH